MVVESRGLKPLGEDCQGLIPANLHSPFIGAATSVLSTRSRFVVCRQLLSVPLQLCTSYEHHARCDTSDREPLLCDSRVNRVSRARLNSLRLQPRRGGMNRQKRIRASIGYGHANLRPRKTKKRHHSGGGLDAERQQVARRTGPRQMAPPVCAASALIYEQFCQRDASRREIESLQPRRALAETSACRGEYQTIPSPKIHRDLPGSKRVDTNVTGMI
jgi:hypothetical protein